MTLPITSAAHLSPTSMLQTARKDHCLSSDTGRAAMSSPCALSPESARSFRQFLE